MTAFGGLALLAGVVAVVLITTAGGSSRHSNPARNAVPGKPAPGGQKPSAPPGRAQGKASESLPRMLGQMIVARFSGPAPSASLLARIRGGQVGGVILFQDNASGGLEATRALVDELQRTARKGGNPPLLVMTDQEGGAVKRLPGPPTLAPSEMTSAAVAFAQGRAAGALLRSVGVNIDLAPVADVDRVPGSFLSTRTFGTVPADVAVAACAFARGVASEHVAYTLKHFPGLGRAAQSTDVAPQSIAASAANLRLDYSAYRVCGEGPLALVMVSSASYPTLTGPLPAVMAPLTYQRELRLATGGSPVVTISDDMQTPAVTGQNAPARHAVNAGLDLLMYAGTEQASAEAYTTLLDEARSGLVSKARIEAAYAAIETLKHAAA